MWRVFSDVKGYFKMIWWVFRNAEEYRQQCRGICSSNEAGVQLFVIFFLYSSALFCTLHVVSKYHLTALHITARPLTLSNLHITKISTMSLMISLDITEKVFPHYCITAHPSHYCHILPSTTAKITYRGINLTLLIK